MPIIESRKHPFKFYLTLTFISLFFIALGLIHLSFFLDLYDGSDTKNKVGMLIASIFFIGSAIILVERHFKNAPQIILRSKNFQIKDRVYAYEDIKKVIFSGKKPFKNFIIDTPMEGFTITLKDGTAIHLFNDMYENTHEIKSYLYQVVKKKQAYKPIQIAKINPQNIAQEPSLKFKSSALTSWRCLILWIVLACMVYLILFKSSWSINALVFVTLVTGFSLLFLVAITHYFKLTPKVLIIKNQTFPWRVRAFNYSDIKEVIIEQNSKGHSPVRLTITTIDFKSRYYCAASLKNSQWHLLIKKLKSKKIKIRDYYFA